MNLRDLSLILTGTVVMLLGLLGVVHLIMEG